MKNRRSLLFDKKYINRLFSIIPTLKSLLLEAPTPRVAREYIRTYLQEYHLNLQRNNARIQPLAWNLQITCLETFRKMISARSERLAKFSLTSVLWKLAHGLIDELPESLNNGFFEEMIHLFRGIQGKSDIYIDEKAAEFIKLSGREAAIVRSDQLDNLALMGNRYLGRYHSGLEEKVIERRKKNKKRILKALNATEDDWNNYLWQIRNVVRTSEVLERLIDLSSEEKTAINKARAGKIPFGITPYYVSLMDKKASRKVDHAVRAQVIPPLNYVDAMLANRADRSGQFDFMLEHDTSPIDLITRRYPRIVILKPYNTCSQICVYCQRNWEIEDVLDEKAFASRKNILRAIEWIADHPAIEEVLITGGDPLVMNDDRVEFVLSNVAQIDHVERIRIGSRTPVVLPQRITNTLMTIISKYHVPGKREVVLVTHFEHPYEITPEAMQAIQNFKRHGMSAYNQAVFTVENSRRYELVALRKYLRIIGVDPYYTFNTKGKTETKNYRVPLARLMQEIKEEARLTPGTVRTDEPVYNVPRLGKNYLRAQQHHTLIMILPDGRRVYEFHPWEKKLALADTYVDTDVPIWDYLQELKRRGEDIDDYNSIWYYY
ncbi:KamA family radical SAM protein [candidate division KSB1 bacterium]|nr:KamA family radical SAM protein [candidate division KSB1 bacterium]RQW07140.1 MAG: KamA family radical SAM protein [candidate division KSB1 bacterium]